MYRERTYREFKGAQRLIPFRVCVKETDLYLKAERNLETQARHAILACRGQIEAHIKTHPHFFQSLGPLPFDPHADPIIQEMLSASQKAQVGPMAAVAGAIAEFVGRTLLSYSHEIIVENGGDIFLQTIHDVIIGIFAGSSPLSNQIGIKIRSQDTPLGICTSSGTVGHSLSFGKADAVTILSANTALADAAATAVANEVKNNVDIPHALDLALSFSGVIGAVIAIGSHIGCQGEVRLIKL
ncbi:MAG: UPF0280 family protein [Deltaproteobacteria bacterium]|nr:UPF0280 family protein [Deltaproteobacteria bacterium]